MAATLQLPFNVQRSSSPVLEVAHANAGMSSLMKKGAHLSRIIVQQTTRDSGRDSVSPKWSHTCAGSLPGSRSPSPRRPLTRQGSAGSRSNGSTDDDTAAAAATMSYGSSPNTLSVPSPPRSVRVSPLPSSPATVTAMAAAQQQQQQQQLERPPVLLQARRRSFDRQRSLERSAGGEAMVTENEEIGARTDDICQAMAGASIGKRKDVTQPQERKMEGLPAKRPKITVAEYAKSVQISSLLSSPNPNAEALLSCLGFGGNMVPFSAPPFQRRPPNVASHSLEALSAQGIPASVLGKRYSAPPVMQSDVSRNRSCSSNGDGRSGPIVQSGALGNAENNNADVIASSSSSHIPLRRTDSDLVVPAISATVTSPSELTPASAASAAPATPASSAAASSSSGPVFLATPAQSTTVPSPTKYVAKRLQLQRRRGSLQAQNRLQQSIPEGSQEDISCDGTERRRRSSGSSRSVSPMPRRTSASFDAAAAAGSSSLTELRNSLEDLGTFVFTGASPRTSRDISPRPWHSMDVGDSMDESDGAPWPRAAEDGGFGGSTAASSKRRSLDTGRSFDGQFSRSLSVGGFLPPAADLRSLAVAPLDRDDDDGDAVTAADVKDDLAPRHVSRARSELRKQPRTGVPAESQRAVFAATAAAGVPSLVLNDDEEAMTLDTGAAPRATAAPFPHVENWDGESPSRPDVDTTAAAAAVPLSEAAQCSMADAANWAGLVRQDPYSYDMSRMLCGYSWERLLKWQKMADESGLQMPAVLPSGGFSAGSRSGLVRTQSLATPAPGTAVGRATAGRTRSLVTPPSAATLQHLRQVASESSKGEGGRAALTPSEKRAMYRCSSTSSSYRDSSSSPGHVFE